MRKIWVPICRPEREQVRRDPCWLALARIAGSRRDQAGSASVGAALFWMRAITL